MHADVYPNPASDILNISIPAAVEGTIELRLLDVAGNLVLTRSIVSGTNTLAVSMLAKGVYLLDLNTDAGRFTRRVIVE